jgi:preprotein translocase SecE subunit
LLHKHSEGRMTRIVGIAMLTILGAYFAFAFHNYYGEGDESLGLTSAIAIAILVIFSLTGFILMFVYKKSSEFAIDVESETKKITWPDWLSVKGHTWQVVIVMIFLMGYLFIVDIFLGYFRGVIL